MSNLHRNNAAEWVMYAVLVPIVLTTWIVQRLRSLIGSLVLGH